MWPYHGIAHWLMPWLMSVLFQTSPINRQPKGASKDAMVSQHWEVGGLPNFITTLEESPPLPPQLAPSPQNLKPSKYSAWWSLLTCSDCPCRPKNRHYFMSSPELHSSDYTVGLALSSKIRNSWLIAMAHTCRPSGQNSFRGTTKSIVS